MSRGPRPATAAMRKALALGFCAAVLVACRDPAPTAAAGIASPPSSPDLVARFGDLEITAGDLDARLLALPPAERPVAGEATKDWYEELVRELAVELRLRAEAAASDLSEDAEFRDACREAERRLAVQLCIAELRPEVGEVTDESLRAAYDASADSFATAERRAVYHVYRRREPAVVPQTARFEIEALRDRVLGGESFQRIAAAHSDSESRHWNGALGWVTPGQLAAGFEEVVFRLPEGVPSEVVATRDGLHLFYVEKILPARPPRFEEVRTALREQLVAERREAFLDEIVAELDPTRVLEQPERRELLYDDCRTHGRIPASQLDAELETWRQEALLAVHRQRRLLAVAGRDEARLRLFYHSNVGRFSRPPRWHLRRLRLPLGGDALPAMARLEEAAARNGSSQRRPGRGGSGLEALRAELGGEIEDLGLKSLGELHRLEPKLPALVAPLAAGDLSPPYRTERALEIAEALDREEAEPLAFAAIRERVAHAYLEQYTYRVYRELADEILRTAELQIVPEGLAALREAWQKRGPDPEPAPLEVSVRQLEELLNEL